jgi:hypothetical protein
MHFLTSQSGFFFERLFFNLKLENVNEHSARHIVHAYRHSGTWLPLELFVSTVGRWNKCTYSILHIRNINLVSNVNISHLKNDVLQFQSVSRSWRHFLFQCLVLFCLVQKQCPTIEIRSLREICSNDSCHRLNWIHLFHNKDPKKAIHEKCPMAVQQILAI